MTRFWLPVLFIVVFLAAPSWAGEPREQPLRVEVTDPRPEITRPIDAALILRMVRVPHERVPHFGWEVQVLERATRGSGTNLLRRKTFSGGPHPTDVLAWLVRDRRFPDDRTLIVPGHPYEIRIRLIDCRTEPIGNDVSFVSGRVDISWRRLDLAGLTPIQSPRAATR